MPTRDAGQAIADEHIPARLSPIRYYYSKSRLVPLTLREGEGTNL